MDIGAVKKTLTTQLSKVAGGGGDTKTFVETMEKAIKESAQNRLKDLPHVRNGEPQLTDPYLLGFKTLILQGSPEVIREAVAELVLDLTGKGAKVQTELDTMASGKAVAVSMVVDLNGVRT